MTTIPTEEENSIGIILSPMMKNIINCSEPNLSEEEVINMLNEKQMTAAMVNSLNEIQFKNLIDVYSMVKQLNVSDNNDHDNDDNSNSNSKTKVFSPETKCAMAWCLFLAETWYNFFKHKENKCEFILDTNENNEEYVHNQILKHVIIFGGGCRDYLLGLDFDDIDTIVNTRELNKLHLNHLRKYHASNKHQQSADVKCCLWRLYANKFALPQPQPQPQRPQREDTEERVNFQLNAAFLIEILLNSNALQNKVSHTFFTLKGNRIYTLNVLQSVEYKTFDLKAQILDIMDAFKLPVGNIPGMPIQNDNDNDNNNNNDNSNKSGALRASPSPSPSPSQNPTQGVPESNGIAETFADFKRKSVLFHQKSKRLLLEHNSSHRGDNAVAEESDDHFEVEAEHKHRFLFSQSKKKNPIQMSMRVLSTNYSHTSHYNTNDNDNDNDNDDDNTQIKTVDLPIHACKVREMFFGNDFSINTMVIFLNDFFETNKATILTMTNDIKYEMKVVGTVDSEYLHDGLLDLNAKILRAPMKDISYTMRAQFAPKVGSKHFYRLVKFRARYDSNTWTIDDDLKQHTMDLYEYWVNEQRFTDQILVDRFIFHFILEYIRKPLSDHPQRFAAMKELEFHSHVIPFFQKKYNNKENLFYNALMAKINTMDNEQEKNCLLQLLKQYKYIV